MSGKNYWSLLISKRILSLIISLKWISEVGKSLEQRLWCVLKIRKKMEQSKHPVFLFHIMNRPERLRNWISLFVKKYVKCYADVWMREKKWLRFRVISQGCTLYVRDLQSGLSTF